MIKRTTLYEQVTGQILKNITDGVYRKGDMLPCEKELTEITGVSRVTVRQALKRLSEMGVIETYKGKGSVVILDTKPLIGTEENQQKYMTDFINSTKARMIIEPEIAKEAARSATEEDLNALEKMLPERGRYGGYQMDGFHLILAESCHNPQIRSIMETLLQAESGMNPPEGTGLIPPEQQKEIMEEVRLQHRKIYNAVRERNPEFACFYMKEHLVYLLKRYEEYFSLPIWGEG